MMKSNRNLFGTSSLGSFKAYLVGAAVLAAQFYTHALTIASGPSFSPATNAPLAGVLQLTTDMESRVSVLISDGTAVWERDFYDYATSHSVPLLGFKPDRTNEITVTVRDKHRNQVKSSQRLVFVTSPLPADFPTISIRVSQPERMEPGYTLFKAASLGSTGYVMIVDASGEVVWYSALPTALDVRQLNNGNLFLPTSDTNGFAEFNLLAERVQSWVAPPDLPVDNHDGVPTGRGTILYLNNASSLIENFPSSSTDPKALLVTTNVNWNRVVEISATNSEVLGNWSLIDMLDPRRINYLTFLIPFYGVDTQHANAIIEDLRDDSLIVSLRNQDAVVKFSRLTGQIKWILGPHENWGAAWQQYLLKPMGSPFEWQYGQHAPIITPHGTLLLYDNGNMRAEPFQQETPDADNYSRAVEYSIDETNMTVTQVWDFGRANGNRLYTDRVGSADWLSQRTNVLITYGYVLYEDGNPSSPYAPAAAMVRIKEVTHTQSPEVVFDLELFERGNTNSTYQGCFGYRSHRIRDLYGPSSNPVGDLEVQISNGTPFLLFSGDQTRTYIVEASTDLLKWQQVGVPTPDPQNAGFYFADSQPANGQMKFYRISIR